MTLLNNILRRKANWIGHILMRNSLFHDAIEGQITSERPTGKKHNYLNGMTVKPGNKGN